MPTTHVLARPTEAIEKFGLWWVSIPLIRPYYTANNPKGRVALDVLLIRVTDKNGRSGWGEACPALTGYSPETPQSGWAFLADFLPKMLGHMNDEKTALVSSMFHEFPFVLSAFYECLADLSGDPLIQPNGEAVEVELAGTVNTLNAEEAAQIALQYADEGYSTLKVKVGMNAQDDAARVTRIWEAVEGRARLRVDANRAYQPASALEFARSVPVEAIEFFEQPFGHAKWRDTEELARESPIPLMLDESIYGLQDIERVAASGCAKAVKLKMSKVGGPTALVEHMNFARDRGLGVVVGNGVASDFGCYREALCCARAGLTTAGEMNGFLKLRHRLLNAHLKVVGPRLILDATSQLHLVEEQMQALAREISVIH